MDAETLQILTIPAIRLLLFSTFDLSLGFTRFTDKLTDPCKYEPLSRTFGESPNYLLVGMRVALSLNSH